MTLYWYSVVDNNWDTLGNWWQDSGHAMPAAELPGDSDSCILLGSIAPIINLDDGIFVTPESINTTGLTEGAMLSVTSDTGRVFENITISGNLAITGSVAVGNSYGVIITGNVYLYDTTLTGADASVSIAGNVYSFDYADIASLTYITGDVYCRGASNTAGTILGNADYWDDAYNNYANIGGNWTYHCTGAANFGNTDPLGLQSGSINGDIIIMGATAPRLEAI